MPVGSTDDHPSDASSHAQRSRQLARQGKDQRSGTDGIICDGPARFASETRISRKWWFFCSTIALNPGAGRKWTRQDMSSKMGSD